MDNEKIFSKLVTATFILSIATLILAVALLVTSFAPVNFQPSGQQQGQEQPKPKTTITKHYARHSISLDRAIAKKKPVAVLFYVDWCGFCQKFAPLFQELSKDRALRKDYTFVFVNCEDQKNSQFVQEYNVNAYPTLYLVNPNTNDKAHVANEIMFTPNSPQVLREQFAKFLQQGSAGVIKAKER